MELRLSSWFGAILSLFLITSTFPRVSALGSIAHLYVADEVLKGLGESNPSISALIHANWDAYAVGADYPDTGYLPWATYGELSHWQPFVDAFLAHLNTSYPTPSPHRDNLLAFILGVCTHIAADVASHWVYYDLVAYNDFHNLPNESAAYNTAHHYMDPATDWYVIVNKRLYDHAANWSVPVTDLVEVYALMGHPEITALEIIRSNVIYYVITGLDETLVALPAYLYEKTFIIPWGMENLEHNDTAELRYGAFPGQINDAAAYVIDTWTADQNHTFVSDPSVSKWRHGAFKGKQMSLRRVFSKAKDLVSDLYDKGKIIYWCEMNEMGSLEISKDCISSPF